MTSIIHLKCTWTCKSSNNYMYSYNSGGFIWEKITDHAVTSLIKSGQKVTKPPKMTQFYLFNSNCFLLQITANNALKSLPGRWIQICISIVSGVKYCFYKEPQFGKHLLTAIGIYTITHMCLLLKTHNLSIQYIFHSNSRIY